MLGLVWHGHSSFSLAVVKATTLLEKVLQNSVMFKSLHCRLQRVGLNGGERVHVQCVE